MLNTGVIVHVAADHALARTRRMLLQHAGYHVISCATLERALRVLGGDGRVDLLLLGIASRAIAAGDVEKARMLRPAMPIVSVARSPVRGADALLAPLAGPDAFLAKIGESIVRAHGHDEVDGEYVMYVDRNRRYIHVSEAVCTLLGYERQELLGMKIEQVSAQPTNAPRMFARYLEDGSQEGEYELCTRDKRRVAVRYRAKVLGDGCMVSLLEPIAGMADRRKAG